LLLAAKEDLSRGLKEMAHAASNPFQRWAAQKALRTLLEENPDLIFQSFETLLSDPLPYTAVGASREEREREADRYFTTRLLLAELAGVPPIPAISDRLACAFTAPLRKRGKSPLAPMAQAYFEMLTQKRWDAKHLDAFKAFRSVRGGEEVYQSFRTMGDFLACGSLDELSRAEESLKRVPQVEEPLRPQVMEALRRLGDIGKDVRAYLAASSETYRRDCLTRAQLGTDEVKGMAQAIHEPESSILTAIAERWRKVIAVEQEKIARPKLVLHIPNNYIIGPPIRPESGRLFVGREDVFTKIEYLWLNVFQKTSVVLHGQRRMGKTSILYHLEQKLGSEYIPILADMQRHAAVSSTGALLYNLADLIQRELELRGIFLPRPELSEYAGEPFIAFGHFLDAAGEALDKKGRWVILMLDEFEKIEEKINAGVFGQDLLEHLRNAMQHRPRFVLIFAGCHTLEDMCREYWSPFFGAAQSIKVSYLDEESARQLITNPWDGFELNYERDAIERIIALTGCQPLLLQAVCSAVIEHINERLKREGGLVAPQVTIEDVEAVSGKALKTSYYFDAVWRELEEGERLALAALAQCQDEPESWVARSEIERALGGRLSAEELEEALELLKKRDMVLTDGRCYRFWVELVRRWVRERKTLQGFYETPGVSLGRHHSERAR
jgi:hypothetical protein